ncbi:MAG: hypothetical protein ACRC6V_09360 [Bacteroidales bacterium]
MHTYIVEKVDGTIIRVEASSFMSISEGIIFYIVQSPMNDHDVGFSNQSYNSAWYRASEISNITMDNSIPI